MLVTVKAMTGTASLAVTQFGEAKLVVDCKVNPAALVAHVKITFAPEDLTASVGAGALTDPNERLNTVPTPERPPPLAVPYRVLPDKINPVCGLAPSLLV